MTFLSGVAIGAAPFLIYGVIRGALNLYRRYQDALDT